MIKSLIATALLSFSIGGKSASTNVERITLSGSYNFRDVIDDFTQLDDGSYDLVFENFVDGVSQNLQIVPIHRSSSTATIWYCDSIHLVKDDYVVDIDFHVYNFAYSHGVTWSYSFRDGDDLIDFSYNDYDLIFEVRQNYVISGNFASIFKRVFTSDDNIYVKSYSGYYSFNSNLTTMNNKFVVFGYSIFNQNTYSFMFNYGDGVHTDTNSGIYMSYYAILEASSAFAYEGFAIESYAFPLNRNVITSSQVLFNGVKMSNLCYQRLSAYGVFAYVRDTSYDNADWHDLLFSVMDSPVYMISRFLNFELFGINLFVALCGLLTVVVIVFLIRKFI